LHHRAFRAIWLASIFSFIGTWVQDVGESWVMLSMSPDPRLVAALAACFLAPTLALTLPAGLLADRIDRRKLLLWSQALSGLAAVGPAVAIHFHHMTPGVLLWCSAALGAAVTIGAPAWSTLVPELLPRRHTAEAVTLGSIAFNIARLVGPALGGFLLAVTSAEATFIVNGVSFLAVYWVLHHYDEVKRASELQRPDTPSRLVAAFADPFREVWTTPVLRGCFITHGTFAIAASMVMAILPAFAKHSLGASATGYGALLSGLGAGAIVSGLFLSRIRSRFGNRATASFGIATFGGAMLFASRAPSVAHTVPWFFIAGLGWIATFSTLTSTVQLTARTETKSRIMALSQLNFYGFATIGSAAGGFIAERWTERAAVGVGAFVALAVALVASRALGSLRHTVHATS
jgi:MFS family permease